MRKIYPSKTSVFFSSLLVAIVAPSACSLPVAGPSMNAITFKTKAPDICFRLAGDHKNKIKLAGLEFFDETEAEKVWHVNLVQSDVTVNEEQCIPYGMNFSETSADQPAKKLKYNHIYSVGVSGDLENVKSESYRQYTGKFCITKSTPPVTHTLDGSNNFNCPGT